ncbi:Gfo/Idh/MocA family protein [Paenibacillus senegalensis]|uniref:Gfo/Idh/MocA family protein n=1 Tax=Paenibacillus senegalensis TaxID=1465766 RepID=UPI000288CF13|nr:Gfo/Idh/MocA family oxidoreductase [Paenibacillus senegalensis]
MRSKPSRKRIGIVGLGSIAEKAYLPLLASHPGVEIIGLVSKRKETVKRFGQLYRINQCHTHLEDLLYKEPDAVFIHTPTETHFDVVSKCLAAGIHVYVDKPLSYEIKQSVAMAEQAERKGKLLCVGFNRRFAPLYVRAKQWMEEAGGIDQCIAQKHRVSKQSLTAKQTLYDDLIHMIDLLLWLGCGSHALTGYFQKDDEQGRLVHASGSLSWGSQSGFFAMNRGSSSDLEKLELYGGGRSAVVTNLDQGVFGSVETGERQDTFDSWSSISYRRGFVGIVEHFLESLDHQEHCQIRADQVLPVHFLIEKLAP